MLSVRPTALSPAAPAPTRLVGAATSPQPLAAPPPVPSTVDAVTIQPAVPSSIGAPPAPVRPSVVAAAPPPVCLSMDETPAVAGTAQRSPASRAVAEQCHRIVYGEGDLEQKADAITALLAPAVEVAPSPDPAWPKASPAELRLFVLETLEHTEGIRRVGQLRGLDFDAHDFEGDTSKFNPEIAQFLARPGRDASVRWAIDQHNAAPHHRLWNDPSSTAGDLRESATDIINAWRMSRRVYQKPSWSWEKIDATIRADFDDGRLGPAQRDALLEAIPFQRECEARFGWSA